MIWRFGDDPAALRLALAGGRVLAFPTESSYGLGVDPRDAEGVAEVFRIKRRPGGKPLPVVASGRAQIESLGVEWPASLAALAERFWPGPLSLLLPLRKPIAAAAGAGEIAVRVPGLPELLRLLELVARPLTATSANLSGRPPVLTPRAAVALVSASGGVVVDGGVLPGGPPSTLVAWRGGVVRVLREGAIPARSLRTDGIPVLE